MVGFMKSALNFLGMGDKKGAAVELDAFLADLPGHLGFDVSIERVEKGDDALYFDVQGEESDSLVGKNAEVLDALAHLSMKILRRKADEEGTTTEKEDGTTSAPFFRVIFDSNGFRDKRVEELKVIARELREKVIEAGGKPAYVPALSPAERKVIHTTLAELGDVMTESLGDGTFKRIRIRLPSDSPHRKPQENTGNSANGEKRFSGGGNRGGNGGGRGPRRGPGNGQGNGGNRGGFRGPRPNNQKKDFNFNSDRAVDGNVFIPESEMPQIDDNIGNRANGSEDNYNK